jgi:hypothetical protein
MNPPEKLRAESRDWFQRQPFAPALTVAFYAFCAIAFNFTLAEALVTKWFPPELVEAFPSASKAAVYWGYVSVIGIMTLIVDVTIIRFLRRASQRKKTA